MDLSVTTHISIAPGQRPAPSAIVDWYEHALRTYGADVERVSQDELSFSSRLEVPIAEPTWQPYLMFASTGDISAEASPSGFIARLTFRPRFWLLAITLVQLGLMPFGYAVQQTPLRYFVAFGGLPVVAVAWSYAWINVASIMNRIGRDLEASYSRTPPPAASLPPN